MGPVDDREAALEDEFVSASTAHAPELPPSGYLEPDCAWPPVLPEFDHLAVPALLDAGRTQDAIRVVADAALADRHMWYRGVRQRELGVALFQLLAALGRDPVLPAAAAVMLAGHSPHVRADDPFVHDDALALALALACSTEDDSAVRSAAAYALETLHG